MRGGGRGAESYSYDRKKAWPSINRSVLSGMEYETWPGKCDVTNTAELVLSLKRRSYKRSGLTIKLIFYYGCNE